MLIPMLGLLLVVAQKPNPPLPTSVLRQAVPPEIRLPARTVKDSENGWTLATLASGQMDSPTIERPEDILRLADSRKQPSPRPDLKPEDWVNRPTPESAPRIEAALRIYEPRIRALRAAVARPFWVPPRMRSDVPPSGPIDPMSFPQTAGLKELAKALQLRAEARLALGRTDEAVDDLILVRQMGDRLAASETTLINNLVGIAIRAIANRGIQRAAAHPALSAEHLERLRTVLEGAPGVEAYALVLRREFEDGPMRLVAWTPDPASAAEPELRKMAARLPRLLDRRATVALAARAVQWQMRNLQIPRPLRSSTQPEPDPLSPAVAAALERLDPRKPRDLERAVRVLQSVDNPLGRSLVGIFTESSQALDAQEASEADKRLTIVILAANAYRLRHGAYPASLADTGLSAKWMEDPTGLGPLGYDPNRRVAWAAGANGVDDGGRNRPGSREPDHVVPIDGAFPVPTKR